MPNNLKPKIKRNDEWDYADALGHNALVRRIGHRLLSCDPPYVVGIGGSWGAGKTSFLRKLWAYLGGPVDWPDGKTKTLNQAGERFAWFQEGKDDFDKQCGGKEVRLIWFNPWQHQFESSPMVALLHEIRSTMRIPNRAFNRMNKAAKLAAYSLFDSLPKLGADIGAAPAVFKIESQLPTAKSVRALKSEFDAEDFSASLGSQRFRDYFEAAIEGVLGKNGLLVIFIDDLDRCEGDVAFRLLEALKLHLNAKNCVYVLGVDHQHLESSIARALSRETETWRHRSLARDYLSKMFQASFLLPVPRGPRSYLDQLLDRDDGIFRERLQALFEFSLRDFETDDWPLLIATLESNLPHNPRKLKSFVASWKTYLDVLEKPRDGYELDWRLTVILQYLAQFEEPLFRRLELFPSFYNDHLLPFCRRELAKPHPLFYGLELPSDEQTQAARPIDVNESGALSEGPRVSSEGGARTVNIYGQAANEGASEVLPEPRFFWISRLINQLHAEQRIITAVDLRRHLPQSGSEE